MAATKLSLETRADGSGIVVPTMLLRTGESTTLYAISRDALDVFVANVAADSWSIQDTTGDIVAGDLVPAIDDKSALFTAALDGTTVAHATATLVGAVTADSGTIWVLDTAVVNLDEAKEYLGETTTSSDDLLASWIKRLTGIVESLLNQVVYPRSVVDILDGSGGTEQYLESGQIVSITGINEAARLANVQSRDNATASWVNLLTDETLIFLPPRDGWVVQLLDGEAFPVGTRNVRIAYKAGFATTSSAYKDIVDLALEMLQIMYDKSKRGGALLGKTTRNMGEGGVSVNVSLKDMSPEWQKRIDMYKRHSFT